ncbi:tripartite tricarboxylate transporter substrate-binding protein [Cupriavidus necator]|uniref:tripartite tricarboxylate transporter substrate-binding protein n=1 Tax=Cupriavidus necator TaxID=106590 RepID=UPI00339D6F80
MLPLRTGPRLASPGTAVDITARFVAEALAKNLKTPVTVDNRAGAGGLIGTDAVAKAAGDGYTLLLAGVPHLTTRWFAEGPVTFDPVKDFVPIARVSSSAPGIVVRADSRPWWRRCMTAATWGCTVARSATALRRWLKPAC